MVSVLVLDAYISDIIPKVVFWMMIILESIVHPLARCLIRRIHLGRLTRPHH